MTVDASPAKAEVEYAVVLFHSTQAAIKAERALIRAGIPVKLIPTPRQLSSDCGTALRSAWADVDVVLATLQAGHVEYHSVHKVSASARPETVKASAQGERRRSGRG